MRRNITQILAFSLLCALLPIKSVNASQCESGAVIDVYDNDFRHAVRRYWPGVYSNAWCFHKSLCYQESLLNPDAQSGAGAVGLCQLLKSTYTEQTRRLNLRQLGRRNPAHNIEVSAAYIGWLIGQWFAPRPHECRLQLVAASYNAGLGHILEAQRLSGGRKCWDLIQGYMYQVTGSHSIETLQYVHKVFEHWRLLRGFRYL